MKWNIGKVLAAGAVSCAVCVGGVQMAAAYQAGGGYVPGSFDRTMQSNQLQFDQNGTSANSKGKTSEEDSFWQQEDDAQKMINRGKDGGYLFANKAVNMENGRTVTAQTANAAMADSTGAAGTAGESYHIVAGGENADLTISGSRDDTAGTESSAGSNQGSEKNPDSVPTTPEIPSVPETPQPSPQPSPTPVRTEVGDPSYTKEPPSMSGIGMSSEEIPTGGISETGGAEIKLFQLTTQEQQMYRGQKIDEKTIFNATEAFMIVSSKVYYWTEQQLGELIRVDAVSFDDGETWLSDFPLEIPMDCEKMQARIAYRGNTSQPWEMQDVSYTVMNDRIYVLKRALPEGTVQLESDDILRTVAFSPELKNEQEEKKVYKWLNLYFYQPDLLDVKVDSYDDGVQLDELFTGWTENGEPVSFFYPLTYGRHILEPGGFVPVPEGYTVTLKYSQTLNREFRDKDTWNTVMYLQTLVDYGSDDGDIDWPDWPDFPWFPDWFSLFDLNGEEEEEPEEPVVLEVPEYVQAVELSYEHTVDKIVLPQTVRYVNLENLVVNDEFDVSEENPYYTAKNGILMNAAQTEIEGVPVNTEELTITAGIKKVELTENNQLKKIVFADDCTEVPEMDISNLENCEIEVSTREMLARVMGAYSGELNAGNNTLNYTGSGSGDKIVIENNCMLENGRLYGVIECGDALMVPDSVTTIAKGSLAYYGSDSDALPANLLVMPRSGKPVALENGWAEGTNIQYILCYTQEQLQQAQKQSGDEIQCRLIQRSQEGFYYTPTLEENGGEQGDEIVVLRAPAAVKSFDGTVTEAQTGRQLTVKVIGDNAFAQCTRLRWVQLPQSVKVIGYAAFKGCYNLEGVLIDSRDEITIGNRSFDDCYSLRFAASNAPTAELKNNYVIPLYSNYSTSYYEFCFAPGSNSGYNQSWTAFVANPGYAYLYDHYEMVDCGGTKVLYMLADDGSRWLALRSGLRMDTDELILPAETEEIFYYACAGLIGVQEDAAQRPKEDAEPPDDSYEEEPKGRFTMPCLRDPEDENYLSILSWVDESSFIESAVSGELVLPAGVTLADEAFFNCKEITSVVLQDGFEAKSNVFVNCTNLTTASIGTWSNSLPANMFGGCDHLQTVTFTTAYPSSDLFLGMGREFCFNNADYNDEEQLRIKVPEGSEERYFTAWRFSWYGYSNYKAMWDAIENQLFKDSDYTVFPTDEEIMQAMKEKTAAAENKLRKMMGMDLVEEASQMYYWYTDAENQKVLVDVSPDVTSADLSPDTLGMPTHLVQDEDGWYIVDEFGNFIEEYDQLDKIAAGAFSRCADLGSVWLPAGLSCIEANAFEGADGELMLMLESEDLAPELTGFAQGEAFTFGRPVQIMSFAWEHDSLFRKWTLPFTGYESYEALYSAVQEAWQQEHPGEEPDTNAIETQVRADLRNAENTLRAMLFGEELLDESEDSIIWKDIWESELEPTSDPDTPGGDEEMKPGEPGAGSDGEDETPPEDDELTPGETPENPGEDDELMPDETPENPGGDDELTPGGPGRSLNGENGTPDGGEPTAGPQAAPGDAQTDTAQSAQSAPAQQEEENAL